MHITLIGAQLFQWWEDTLLIIGRPRRRVLKFFFSEPIKSTGGTIEESGKNALVNKQGHSALFDLELPESFLCKRIVV